MDSLGERAAILRGNRNTSDWVHETRFGNWFVGTGMWRQHVLLPSILELKRLLGPPRPGMRILDVCCGEGLAFALIEDHFRPSRILGIDVDPKLVSKARQAARSSACRIDVAEGNCARLDLADGSVDAIFCHQSFHHISDQEQAAGEFYRVLAPGGVLLLAESCRSFIWSLWVRLLFRHPMDVQKTAEEYLALLRSIGFRFGPENVSTPYPPWSRPDFGLAELLIGTTPHNRTNPLVYVAATRPA